MADFFKKLGRKINPKAQALPAQKTRKPKKQGETCDDEDVLMVLEDIMKFNKNLLKGQGVEKLYELLQGKAPICTKTPTQKRYVEYIKAMSDQLQREMDESNNTILKLQSDKVKAQREREEARNSASECFAKSNQDKKKIIETEKQLESKSKEAYECKNKIQQLRPKPQIKSVGGIPTTLQRKTPTRKSLSPRAKETYQQLTTKQSPSPRSTKVMKEDDKRRFAQGTPELGELPIPTSSLWPKYNQNF